MPIVIFLPVFEFLLFYFLVATVVAGILFILPKLLSPKAFSIEKLSAYECGFEPFVSVREAFESHFVVVAILFIIFDLEMIFIFPWAVTAGITSWSGFLVMLVFLGLLGFGLVYEWVRGALTWPIFFLFKKKFFF